MLMTRSEAATPRERVDDDGCVTRASDARCGVIERRRDATRRDETDAGEGD